MLLPGIPRKPMFSPPLGVIGNGDTYPMALPREPLPMDMFRAPALVIIDPPPLPRPGGSRSLDC